MFWPLRSFPVKYTAAAWANFINKPEDRGALVDNLLKSLGGRLISICCTSGEWDGLVIYEAPDEKVALAALPAIISPGHLAETQTCLLYSMKDMIKVLETAKAPEFRGIEGGLPAEMPTQPEQQARFAGRDGAGTAPTMPRPPRTAAIHPQRRRQSTVHLRKWMRAQDCETNTLLLGNNRQGEKRSQGNV